jgi:CRISPR-associated protein Cas2
MLRYLFLVAYDIESPRVRRRVLRAIRGHAIGGQKSLYECWLTSGELQAAMHEVRLLVDASSDRVMFVRLDPRAIIHTRGIAVEPVDGELFYVG